MASNVRKLRTDSSPPVVERTTAGLRDALFDELEGLRLGIYDPGHVSASASVAHAIIRVMRLELDYARLMMAKPELEQVLAPVKLGSDPSNAAE